MSSTRGESTAVGPLVRRDSGTSDSSDSSMHTVASHNAEDLDLVDPFMLSRSSMPSTPSMRAASTTTTTTTQRTSAVHLRSRSWGGVLSSAARHPLPASSPPSTPLPPLPPGIGERRDAFHTEGDPMHSFTYTRRGASGTPWTSVLTSRPGRLLTLAELQEHSLRDRLVGPLISPSPSVGIHIDPLDSFINFDHSSDDSDGASDVVCAGRGGGGSGGDSHPSYTVREKYFQDSTSHLSDIDDDNDGDCGPSHKTVMESAAQMPSPSSTKSRRRKLYKPRSMKLSSSLGLRKLPSLPSFRRHPSSTSQDTVLSASSFEETRTPSDEHVLTLSSSSSISSTSTTIKHHARVSSWSRMKDRLAGVTPDLLDE